MSTGSTLLALIIEEATGRSYRDHTEAEILRLPDGRLTAGASGDFAGPHWALDGNGGLAMTSRDLATWTHALFTGQVVGPEAVEVLTSTRFDQGDGIVEVPGWVAFDATRFGEPAFVTAGGGGDVGHDAVVAWLPESERVIAMASNTPAVTAEDLLRAVGPAIIAGDPVPAPATGPGTVDPAQLAAVAGTCELATGGSLDVAPDGERLAVSAHGADAVAVLFPLPAGFTAEDVAEHEDGVMALLAGDTREGREERAAFESAVGPIDDITLAGTIVADGELRTHVAIASGAQVVGAWYALDAEGGLAAAELSTAPPALLLVPADGATYRPDDPAGTGPQVTVAFGDRRMTVTGPTGSTDAELDS